MNILDYKKEIIIFIGGSLLGIIIMLIFWPSRIAKLKDGSEVVASVNDKNFTADELYQRLKGEYGIENLIDEIDTYLLHQKYPNLKDESIEYANKNKDNVYESYQQYYGYSKKEFLEANNFSSEEEFIVDLANEYYFQKYYEDYLRDNIKETDIKNYYDNYVFGDRNIYMFASSDVDNKLNDVIKNLKSGKSFDYIKKKYKDIESYNFKNVKFNDTDQFSLSLLKSIATVDKGKPSNIIYDEKYGYVVIYVVTENKKTSLDNASLNIKDLLVEEMKKDESDLYYQAFIDLRNEYNLKIYDTELDRIYKKSINSKR